MGTGTRGNSLQVLVPLAARGIWEGIGEGGEGRCWSAQGWLLLYDAVLHLQVTGIKNPNI